MESKGELSDAFFLASFFFFPDGSLPVHPLAGLNCLRSRGVNFTCGVVLKRLKVLCSVPSRSGPGSSSGNGNSLHGTVVDVPSAAVDVFVVLGFLASLFIGTDGVLPLFLAGVTGSPLGVTSPKF